MGAASESSAFEIISQLVLLAGMELLMKDQLLDLAGDVEDLRV